MSGELDELLLAGYVPLGASGFALPCFAAQPRANAWHVAVCSIDGDHRGEVVGFRPFDEAGVEHLRADLHRQVRMGDPWVDVFLLRGTPLVGTPPELMEELAPVIADAEAAAPISLLDLALAADEADIGDLARLAHLHVERSHGAKAAGSWRRGLMAAQMRLAVRRQMAAAGISGPLATEARRATVEETAAGLVLDLRDLLIGRRVSRRVVERSASPAHLLSLATERTVEGRAPEGTGFFSEATVRRLVGRPDPGHIFEFEVAPLRKAASRVRRGWISAGPPAQDFGRFVHNAMAKSARLARRFAEDRSETTADPDRNDLLDRYRIEPGHVPDEIASTLRAPRFVTGLSLGRLATVVVTAETPSLKTLRAAGRMGVPVVRYTDRETIEDILCSEIAWAGSPLPREVRLPVLERLESNRGLVTRGVDSRDVLQLPLRRSEWGLSRAASAAVSSLVRGYLTRAGGEVEGVALPLDEIVGLVSAGGAVAEELRKVLSLDSIGRRARLLKRPSDLRVAWAKPAKGAARFVVEDGRFPIRLAKLPPDVVPDQRLFIVDGDAAVPLLLGSRLFAVWARATTSRSTSWLSRFSVTGTFETLPVPPGLKLRLDEVGRFGLFMDSGPSELTTIADDIVRAMEERSSASALEAETDPSDPLRHKADARLLKAIDLAANASDIDVLDRLVSLNRRGPGTDARIRSSVSFRRGSAHE